MNRSIYGSEANTNGDNTLSYSPGGQIEVFNKAQKVKCWFGTNLIPSLLKMQISKICSSSSITRT